MREHNDCRHPDALAGALAKLDQLQVDGASLLARAATAAYDLGKRITDRDELSEKISQILKAYILN